MGLLANAKERRQERRAKGRTVVKAVIVTERIVGIAAGEVSVPVEVNRHSHLRALPRVVLTRAMVVIIIATSTAISILTSTLISIRSQQLYSRGKH